VVNARGTARQSLAKRQALVSLQRPLYQLSLELVDAKLATWGISAIPISVLLTLAPTGDNA
jgi:hypothetical protein